MPPASLDSAAAPHTLRNASIVTLVYVPAVTVAMFVWFMVVSDGRSEPMIENLLLLLPVVCVAVVVSGLLLRRYGVRAAFGLGALVTLAVTFCFAFVLESWALNSGWGAYLFLVLPVPVVFVALSIGGRVPRAGLRMPAAWVVVVVALLLTDGSMRHHVAQEQQQDAADALATYDTVAVLDAPGWTLTHAYDESLFPELVYRDPLGRTVLLGATPEAPGEGDPDRYDSVHSDNVLGIDRCDVDTEGDLHPVFARECEEQNGLLVVRMEGAFVDREVGDNTDRWPWGWTEVRLESADGRYVRIRSASPGVDLVDLAEEIEDVRPTDPTALASEASCLLRCPVWRTYGT